jgi:hypothetical protein
VKNAVKLIISLKTKPFMPKSIEITPLKRGLFDGFKKPSSFGLFDLDKFLHENEIKGFEALQSKKIAKDEVTLFYPGSENDVIMPTLMLIAFADFRKAKIVLANAEADIKYAAGLFQQLTHCKKFKQEGNKCTFFFEDRTFEIICHKYDVLQGLPPIGEIDIYFERAFQVFRQSHPEYFPIVKSKLAKGAIVISDFGDILDMEIIETPEEAKALGFYKNFSVFTLS